MKTLNIYRLLVVGCVMSAVAATPASQARAELPGALQLEAAIGGNICVDNGDTKCNGLDALLYGRLGAYYRIWDYIYVGGEINVGGYDTNNDNTSSWALRVTGAARFQIDLGELRLMAGIGLGFLHSEASLEIPNPLGTGTISSTASHDGMAVVIPAGVSYMILDALWVGVDFSFMFTPLGSCGSNCDYDLADRPFNIQTGIFAAFHIL